MEFEDNESAVFDDIMDMLQKYPDFHKYEIEQELPLSLPGLEIYPDKRKIYRDRQEIHLTAKEYDLLCLLVYNQGRVLTYEQIYQKVWGEEPFGKESNAIGCHIRNLREKLFQASPNTPFNIKCVREVGYCLETEKD